jgi:flagellar basal body L-ring protein FlgH
MIRRLVTVLLLIFSVPADLTSKTLWRDRNIYSTSGQLAAGDVIVVEIRDISSLRFTIDLSNKSNATVATSPDRAITGFLPPVAADKTIKSGNVTDFKGSGKMFFTVASTVTGVANGRYALTGVRTYAFNGITTSVRVSGTVDSALLQGRSVDSRNVADFRMEVRETREGVPIVRGPLAEGQSAVLSLTEEEKQRIIVDYLQKILGELTR